MDMNTTAIQTPANRWKLPFEAAMAAAKAKKLRPANRWKLPFEAAMAAAKAKKLRPSK